MDPLVVPVTMTLTKSDLGMAKSHDAPFTTHPDPELFKFHSLEKFGCSPCHGGNGRALDSVEKAHGRYEHWLWPLNYPENYNAGCQNCHASDMVTEHAEVLNRGRSLYRTRGCIGCHKYAGFDDENERLTSTRQQITQLESTKSAYALQIPRLNTQADQASDNTQSHLLRDRALNLTVESAKLDSQIEAAGYTFVVVDARGEARWAGPERSADEAAQGMGTSLAGADAHVPSDDKDAAIPLRAGRDPENRCVYLASGNYGTSFAESGARRCRIMASS